MLADLTMKGKQNSTKTSNRLTLQANLSLHGYYPKCKQKLIRRGRDQVEAPNLNFFCVPKTIPTLHKIYDFQP